VDLRTLQKNWDSFGETDPLWAILTDPAKKGGKWDLEDFLQTGTHEIAATLERLKSLGISTASRRALDFGCGIGRLTQALSARFDEAWGVDIAPSMIALAKRINAHPDRCRYLLNETNDLACFPSQHFDFVYSRLVLQHMLPVYAKDYILEFLRVLAPGGVLIFQMPDSMLFPPAAGETGRRSRSTGPMPADAFAAGIVCTPAKTEVEAGSAITVNVAVTNRSKTAWPCFGQEDGKYFVRLGNHWLDGDLNLLLHDDARANLPRDLEPGHTAELVLNVSAPVVAGDYILELDMVQEAVAWFADCGSQTAKVKFRVIRGVQEAHPQTTAVMEMHGLPKKQVLQLISRGGGEIVELISDDSAGPEWSSYTYCVKKPEQPFTQPETNAGSTGLGEYSPFCTILVVNFNGKYLDACLRSLETMDYPAERLEIVVVDNGSDDGSDAAAQLNHPDVRVLHSPKNNFAAALNLGVKSSTGDYVAFCNNDVFMSRDWLKELVGALEKHPSAGCAAGKILLEDGRINSVWHRALPGFYWEDEGYGEQDSGQYEQAREVDGVCWAAVLFRRACLQDVGPIDEDYVMYYEDVDTSEVCRQLGWAMLYEPRAVTTHVFHGSSDGPGLAEFFCDRSRLIYTAKHHPVQLAETIRTSRYLQRGEAEALYDAMPVTIKKLLESHPASLTQKVLEEVAEALEQFFGPLAVDHLFARLQVILGHRKMSIGLYDHAAQLIGGGQKYGCTLAAALRERYDVTIVSNRSVAIADLEQWYRTPLSGVKVEIVPLPYFEDHDAVIDATQVAADEPNPFDPVSRASREFDVFINVNMLAMVEPRSPFSVFICHFPDSTRPVNFSVDDYTCVIVNSRYTSSWARARWGIEPSLILYSPVDMAAAPRLKDRIILSAARFEYGGSKKQIEVIQAYEKLRRQQPELMAPWRLVLVGGSAPDNPYLKQVERAAAASSAPIEIHVNVSSEALKSHYARARIFWHTCGLGESDPHLVEHFGMTTVEAMQNRCVPIVINGGGQKEIVEQGVSGYRFNTMEELCERTREVIASAELAERLGEAASRRAMQFHRERFDSYVREFFARVEEEYRTIRPPDPRDILKKRRAENLFYSPSARRGLTVSPAPAPPVPS